MAETITLELARYRPEEEAEPTFQEYEVPYHKDWVLLDGLNYIKDQIDGTLSYRWSCRMGICGSCGMTVNGEPKLTCETFLNDYANQGTVRLEPLTNFPVIRDLVVALELCEFVTSQRVGVEAARDGKGEDNEHRFLHAELLGHVVEMMT